MDAENLLMKRKSILDFRPLLEITNEEDMFKMFVNSELDNSAVSNIIRNIIDKFGYDKNTFRVVGGMLRNLSKMKAISIIDLEKGPYVDVYNNISVCTRDMDLIKIKDKYVINDACTYFVSDAYILKKEDDKYSYRRTYTNVGYDLSNTPIIVDVDMNDDGTMICTGRICMFNILGEAVMKDESLGEGKFNSIPILEQSITFPITSLLFEGDIQKIVCMNQYNRQCYESDENSIIKPYFININDLKGVNVYEVANNPDIYLNFTLSDIFNMI
jgi:hypothetical protein|nr:MAG TPA: hypothetical protein [Caudoviricetes sp.]